MRVDGWTAPPLSRDLRDFLPREWQLPPSVGKRVWRASRFPECHPTAVHWPERFRGGCAFGAGGSKTAPPDSPAGGLNLTHANKLKRAPLSIRVFPTMGLWRFADASGVEADQNRIILIRLLMGEGKHELFGHELERRFRA